MLHWEVKVSPSLDWTNAFPLGLISHSFQAADFTSVSRLLSPPVSLVYMLCSVSRALLLLTLACLALCQQTRLLVQFVCLCVHVTLSIPCHNTCSAVDNGLLATPCFLPLYASTPFNSVSISVRLCLFCSFCSSSSDVSSRLSDRLPFISACSIWQV